MEQRSIRANREIKGKLFLAHAGDVVYSKIDVRNGAIGIVPENLPVVAVTSEFPVYEVRKDIALPMYIKLLFRTEFFRRTINGIISGASGRKRVQPTQLVDVEVPLPPLRTQQAIVDRWQQAQTEIASIQAQSDNLEAQRKLNFLDTLGGARNASTDKQRCFALPWAKIERWSIEYLQRACFGGSFEWGYPCEPLTKLCKGQSGGTPLTSNARFWNGDIPWVSPKDMKVFRVTDAQDHISKDAVTYSSAPMIPEKSVLVVVRSGILQRVVPVAINDIAVSINQDMRAFTVTDERLLPEFLAYFLEARSDELLSLVKWSTTVQSINREELEAYPIPLRVNTVIEGGSYLLTEGPLPALI